MNAHENALMTLIRARRGDAPPKKQKTIETAAINPPDGTPLDEEPPPVTVPDPAPKRGRPAKGPFLTDGTNISSLKKGEMQQRHADLRQSIESEGLTTAYANRSEFAGKGKKDAWQADIVLMDTLLASIRGDSDVPPLPPKVPAPAPAPAPLGDYTGPINGYTTTTTSDHVIETSTAPSVTLYVGCCPRKSGDVTYLSDILSNFQAETAAEAGVGHYLSIKYSEGPKTVAGKLALAITTGALELPTQIVIDRRLPGADAALEVLLNHATSVIERMG